MKNTAKTISFDLAVAQLAVDRLGDARARMKMLKDEIAGHEAVLKRLKDELDISEVDGVNYRAVVTDSVRTTSDWKKMALDLGANAIRIAKNSKETFVRTVRVSAHKK